MQKLYFEGGTGGDAGPACLFCGIKTGTALRKLQTASSFMQTTVWFIQTASWFIQTAMWFEESFLSFRFSAAGGRKDGAAWCRPAPDAVINRERKDGKVNILLHILGYNYYFVTFGRF